MDILKNYGLNIHKFYRVNRYKPQSYETKLIMEPYISYKYVFSLLCGKIWTMKLLDFHVLLS